ncbi:FAD:protein FMN transferase [Candidatus Collierbacteria bacterium]|nr:FAD:protein FMN transferase [Candidatus Collierbacteria bacterium]
MHGIPKIGKPIFHFPPGFGIDALDYADIRLDSCTRTITLPSRAALDLNSIVKGLGLDMALACFGNTENIIIEAGGDIKVQGLPPQADAWAIGIRNPIFPQKIITVIHVRDSAVCTSGEYFRKTHLINPMAKKSKGNDNSISSVTVVATTAREADALSTAAYFMDIDEGIFFVENHDCASCLIIDSNNNVYAGPRMKSCLT